MQGRGGQAEQPRCPQGTGQNPIGRVNKLVGDRRPRRFRDAKFVPILLEVEINVVCRKGLQGDERCELETGIVAKFADRRVNVSATGDHYGSVLPGRFIEALECRAGKHRSGVGGSISSRPSRTGRNPPPGVDDSPGHPWVQRVSDSQLVGQPGGEINAAIPARGVDANGYRFVGACRVCECCAVAQLVEHVKRTARTVLP